MEIQDPWTVVGSPGERSLLHCPPCALGIRAQNGSTSEDNTSSPDQSGPEQLRLAFTLLSGRTQRLCVWQGLPLENRMGIKFKCGRDVTRGAGGD